MEGSGQHVAAGGHIHPAYGRYRLGETEIVNASLVDERYRPVNPVVQIVF